MDTLLTLGIAFVAGIMFYYMDLNKGRKWNTRWYDLTHQHKSPVLLEKGLIHLQPFQQKLVMAIVLSGLFTAVAIAVGGAHALLDLITGAIAVVGSDARFLRRRADLQESLQHGTRARGAGQDGPYGSLRTRNWNIINTKRRPVQRPDKAAPVGGAPKEEPPTEEKPDWRAGIKKIMDKK
jgi:hypothetical protein